MVSGPDKRSFAASLLAHTILFLVLVVNVYFSKPIAVFENTNKQDVISAVVLGDIPESKIVPQKITPPPPEPKKLAKVEVKPVPETTKTKPQPAPVVKDVIALSKPQKKEIKKTKVDDTKLADSIAKGLLEDIKKQKRKTKPTKLAKRNKQKELAVKFQKELQMQAELTMRQQMLEDDLRIKGERARQAQGEVNKYKALIIQSISENWIIPTQSDRKLSSELLIRLSPGGTVLDVQVTHSSGDPALDSSARAAVLKSSPLPVPHNPEAFQAFKRFVLKVKPENVL